MKIYIAYTGGTIGMKESDDGLIPDPDFAEVLQKQLEEVTAKSDVKNEYCVYRYPELIDSSNATPEEWRKIALDVSTRWDDFDAFIVLHGTDTMAYTSSALYYMLENASKPVVVTGSQVPMFQARTDGLNNVLGAISACNEGKHGVSLFFGSLLIAGNRAHKANTTDWQAFSSPNYPVLGTLGIDWVWTPLTSEHQDMTERLPEMQAGAVTLLPVFPGVSAQSWSGLLTDQVKGAVLLSYGAGNAPDKDDALLAMLKNATERGVCIVNVSQCGAGSVVAGAYAAGSALVKAGVVSGQDMTYEAAFTKLHVAIGCGLEGAALRAEFE
ncbi:asparaginase domain-containing protein [Marinomonas mediterranea]|uniref:1-alkyl-2-acetylglycerophosphocholine esterase n=1 Tax=Marinomonas mediterranea (strain ATCC 700492 / JCM 21426 / NBRC 103028 / MMB-1) TaxID=717774 RepID=F2JWT3_MARM1|nr:asparaginase domain-containing protein [Marinomonas mediterranea]ADZ92950.1 1-alkyl-2-acetylglycerophosphocholine esterase [Marinomonas mediterranea MMB-1]WCN10870.1 L-asparaginase 1 [Marinomonas mediterranea]WCN14927.1 L-asparaginase 1 [Marinomonas mediterranea]WCN18971.1 L-asparaginase 1 [Marinomonas mediterranea MMB-1]